MLVPAVSQPAQTGQPEQPKQVAKPDQPRQITAQPEGGVDSGPKGRTLQQKQQIDPSIVIVEHPSHWYTSWWFWTAVGVVVVGATVGTVLYIESISPDHGEATISWQP